MLGLGALKVGTTPLSLAAVEQRGRERSADRHFIRTSQLTSFGVVTSFQEPTLTVAGATPVAGFALNFPVGALENT